MLGQDLIAAGDRATPVESPAEAPDVEVALLKARVEALERTVAGLQHVVQEATRGTKMRWIAAGTAPDFSDLQAEALRGNLSILPAQQITIEAPSGDAVAHERAEWFKTVFTEARWSVHGPEEAPAAHVTRPGVSLATTLPVPAKAAVAFLAVRAAGFEIATIFDAELGGDEARLVVA